jgi:hypothetical protein
LAKNEFDYSEFKKFYEKNERLQQEFVSWLKNFLTQRALEALALTRPLTPVRTGYLRRNWSVTDVTTNGKDLVVHLVNPVEYASFMEEGYSYENAGRARHFEGYHMSKIAISQIKEKMPGKFKNEFSQFLKQFGWK